MSKAGFASAPSSRRPRGSAVFFDGLRTAEGRLPAGLVRLGAPASRDEIARAEAALGRPLPHAYAEFLGSFNGADLFHEALVVHGVGAAAQRDLVTANTTPHPGGGHDEEITIAEGAGGEIYTLELETPESGDEPRVFRVRAEPAGEDADEEPAPDARAEAATGAPPRSDVAAAPGSPGAERWLAGSSFPRWLEAAIAHQALLYDGDGEFLADAFEPDGEELTPTFALRQAERALKKDPGSALYQYEHGVALRRLGKTEAARAAFGQAAAADPTNPWPWFELGRCDHALGRYGEAAAAFECAAEASNGPEAARFFAWAARGFYLAGERPASERLRNLALTREPNLVAALTAAAKDAREGDEIDAAKDAEELAALLGSPIPLSRRLPVLASQPNLAAALHPAPAKAPPARKTVADRPKRSKRSKPARPRKKK